jgi:hypothetical protein
MREPFVLIAWLLASGGGHSRRSQARTVMCVLLLSSPCLLQKIAAAIASSQRAAINWLGFLMLSPQAASQALPEATAELASSIGQACHARIRHGLHFLPMYLRQRQGACQSPAFAPATLPPLPPKPQPPHQAGRV